MLDASQIPADALNVSQAAYEFKRLRGLTCNGSLSALHEWAGERALITVEGAERLRCLLLRQDPPARPIPPVRASAGARLGGSSSGNDATEASRPASTPAPATASGDATAMMLPITSTLSAGSDEAEAGREGTLEQGETQDLERECCICLEPFPREKLLGICLLLTLFSLQLFARAPAFSFTLKP